MGRSYQSLEQPHIDFLQAQPVFFVATAPLSGDGHINCSPKGGDSLRLLDANTVAYLDLPGSGVETIAHLQENRRIVLMACAFNGAPRICRLHGHGEVITPLDGGFSQLYARFSAAPAVRAIILIHVSRVSDSCGYGVPLMEFSAARKDSAEYVARSSDQALRDYVRRENALSIDGLPGLAGANAKSIIINRTKPA